jgi:hypothetical protein
MIDEKDYSTGEHADGEPNVRKTLISSRNRKLLIVAGTAVLVGVVVLFLWPRHESANKFSCRNQIHKWERILRSSGTTLLSRG